MTYRVKIVNGEQVVTVPIPKDMTIYIKWAEKDASDENGGVGDGPDQDNTPAVRTGDASHGTLWMALLLLSATVVAFGYVRKQN